MQPRLDGVGLDAEHGRGFRQRQFFKFEQDQGFALRRGQRHHGAADGVGGFIADERGFDFRLLLAGWAGIRGRLRAGAAPKTEIAGHAEQPGAEGRGLGSEIGGAADQSHETVLRDFLGIGRRPGESPGETVDGIAIAVVEDAECGLVAGRGLQQNFLLAHWAVTIILEILQKGYGRMADSVGGGSPGWQEEGRIEARATNGSQGKLSAIAWVVLILLAVSGFLNYFDRSNLAVGATDIQREMNLNLDDLGKLQSAFFWFYSAMQFLGIAGWLVDRFNVCWVLAGGFFIWSAATTLTGAAEGFATIFALRLLLGIGESIAYPSYSRILANYYSEHRGLANAAIDCGTKMGPALGTVIGGLLMLKYGWRPFFVGLGIASLLWLLPWAAWMPRGRAVATRQHAAGVPSTWAILGKRAAWATAFGLFCSNYFWYFLLTWLPHYLETERHFDKTKMSWLASLAYLSIGAASMASGWYSDKLIARGWPVDLVRKGLSAVGLLFSTAIVGVVVSPGDRAAMAFLMFACVSFGIYTPHIYAMTQALAGPRASGKWTGLQNGFGNLAGIAAPWFTGWVTQRTGHFYWAFVAAAMVVVAGAGFWVFGVRKVEPVEW